MSWTPEGPVPVPVLAGTSVHSFSKMVEIMKCIPPDIVTENLSLGDQIF